MKKAKIEKIKNGVAYNNLTFSCFREMKTFCRPKINNDFSSNLDCRDRADMENVN